MILAFALRAEGQQVPACLKELAAPLYPPLASQARVQGEVVLKFSVDAKGNPGGISTEGHKLLVPGALRAIEAVRFDPKECGGRQFNVRYQFKIGASESSGVAFVPPSGFKVTTGSKPLIAQYSNVLLDEVCLKPLVGKLVYPHLARLAGVQGFVDVVFHLDAAGSVLTTELEGHKLLTGGVKIQAPEFRFDIARCGDRCRSLFSFSSRIRKVMTEKPPSCSRSRASWW